MFCGDCTFLYTTVTAHVGEISFKARGKEIKEWGWRIVYADMKDVEEKEADKEKATILPVFRKGESGSHTPKLTEKWTTAPKHYTEATLLQAMETAGKFVEDEEIRSAVAQCKTRTEFNKRFHREAYVARKRGIYKAVVSVL